MKKKLLLIGCFLNCMQPLHAEISSMTAFGDLLYWNISEETGSIWASVIKSPNASTTDFIASNIDFDWDHGFRLGLTHEPGKNAWNIALYWTHFSTHTSSNIPAASQIIAPEFFSGFFSQDVFFGATIDWYMLMNMFDIQASRKITIGKSLTLQPQIGIKGGIIHQTIHANWDATLYSVPEELHHNFHGIGPSFGVKGSWNICSNVDLIGHFSTAFIWGKWKISDTYTRPEALLGLVTPTTIETTMENSLFGTLMVDYFVGLQWIYTGRSDLSFEIGYEMQLWSNQLRIPTFQILPVHGDLTLQGATCRIHIDL